MIHKRAMDKVQQHVDDGLAMGAKLLIGGKALPELGPHFYAPTILGDMPTKGTLMSNEETFGPVCGLSKVRPEFRYSE
jgi:succinate-semialdehyde dehydrogenase / glutarate-semialdehyde dehydrogenase